MKNFLTVLLFLFFAQHVSFGQVSDLVQCDSIVHEIHKRNVGKIAFMGQPIPIEDFSESDFLTTFELKDSSDLNIRVFLSNSLTNYLHQLSPELSAEELTGSGNYQFSFIVDNRLIYVEDLNAGAGSNDSKNRKTVFRVPLISLTNEDSWGRFLWNRFMMKGGQDALNEGEHELKIEIRPYLKSDETVTGNIIAEGSIKIIVPELKIDEEQVRVQQILPLDDLEISSDGYNRIAIEDLNRQIAKQKLKGITSIVVIKDGKILIEEYFNGANRNTLHDTRSVGKSFASAITGIAISGGYLKSESQTLMDFYNLKEYQNYSLQKEDITLKDLLTMNSPFNGSDMNPDSPGNEENMYPSANWVEFTLNLPLDSSKFNAKRWDYFTAGVVLLGDILNKAVPGGMENYAERNLFQPLNIEEYKWQYTPQNVANTAGSLQMHSLDYAKFGQLYKNLGEWKGKQILSREWVANSLSRQSVVSEDEYYGYLFWNKTYTSDGVDYETYYASGNGGNRIVIFKDLPLVIVITSTAYNTPYGNSQSDKILQNYLLPAVTRE